MAEAKNARSAYWSMVYAADRRAHRHRCCCGCNQIVQPGEAVFMARTLPKGTRVLKQEHAERQHSGDFTALDALEAWGMEYLAAVGFAHAKRLMDTDPICLVGGRKADRPAIAKAEGR